MSSHPSMASNMQTISMTDSDHNGTDTNSAGNSRSGGRNDNINPHSNGNQRSSGSLYPHSAAVAVVPESTSSSSTVERRNDYLVSEQEEEDNPNDNENDDNNDNDNDVDRTRGIVRSESVVGGTSAPTASASLRVNEPAEIPPEPDVVDDHGPNNWNESDGGENHRESDESDYEYDYEDDDDGHYSGFLITEPVITTTSAEPDSNTTGVSGTRATSNVTEAVPQASLVQGDDMVEEDCSTSLITSTEKTSRKEDSQHDSPEGDAGTSSSVKTLPQPPLNSQMVISSTATATTTTTTTRKSKKWNQPSQAAISMSLRAETETTGGRKRLASDLYKIMCHDSQEAGFSIEPKNEDSMDKWIIRLFQFDPDSNLAKDLICLGLDCVELEMSFPEQYPFEPPFVRVVRPRFKKQTGFVMNGALCMELLTKQGWNPVNDIESVIVSVRSLLVVGDGRLQAALEIPEKKREALIAASNAGKQTAGESNDKDRDDSEEEYINAKQGQKRKRSGDVSTLSTKKKNGVDQPISKATAGYYTVAEARAAYSHLSDYHKEKGWDSSGWWARKG